MKEQQEKFANETVTAQQKAAKELKEL